MADFQILILECFVISLDITAEEYIRFTQFYGKHTIGSSRIVGIFYSHICEVFQTRTATTSKIAFFIL